MNLGEVFAEPLVDLGDSDPAFAGIVTPRSALGAVKVGVTAQFLDHAEEYHRRYHDVDYWRFLIGNALEKAAITGEVGTVIDIGSGSTLLAMAAFRQTAGSTTLADPTSRLAALSGEVDVGGGRLSGPGTVDGTLRNAGVVAPAHATVVSTFEKLTMPGTVAFVTAVCALAARDFRFPSPPAGEGGPLRSGRPDEEIGVP